MTTKLVAIRSVRSEGKAHLLAAGRGSFGLPTRCGRALSNPVRLAWRATAPEDRCTRCTKIAQEDT